MGWPEGDTDAVARLRRRKLGVTFALESRESDGCTPSLTATRRAKIFPVLVPRRRWRTRQIEHSLLELRRDPLGECVARLGVLGRRHHGTRSGAQHQMVHETFVRDPEFDGVTTIVEH